LQPKERRYAPARGLLRQGIPDVCPPPPPPSPPGWRGIAGHLAKRNLFMDQNYAEYKENFLKNYAAERNLFEGLLLSFELTFVHFI
jgi:hypothetical protein